MNNTTTMIATLTQGTGRWVKNTFPPVGEELVFKFTPEQFALAQRIVSEASLGPTLVESVQFLVDREVSLLGQEDEEGRQTCRYCTSGWQYLEEEKILYLWYETTSGTRLCHTLQAGEPDLWEVFLPKARSQGFHHKELTRVGLGMTSDQYDRWYNSDLGDDKIAHYAERSAWHNRLMVPLGWEVMMTVEQPAIHRQTKKSKCESSDEEEYEESPQAGIASNNGFNRQKLYVD